jgi:hypothetical protein
MIDAVGTCSFCTELCHVPLISSTIIWLPPQLHVFCAQRPPLPPTRGQQCFCCWRSISCCLDRTKSLVWRLRAALPKLRTVHRCVHDEWQISCNTSSFQNAVFFSELEITERFQKPTNACILLSQSERFITHSPAPPVTSRCDYNLVSMCKLATNWTVRELTSGGGQVFRTRPNRSRDLNTLLYNRYWVSFPGVKRPGRGVNHPPPSSAEVKEKVQLYFLSRPSWSVLGRTLPLPLYECINCTKTCKAC